jgi:hypothetical protein
MPESHEEEGDLLSAVQQSGFANVQQALDAINVLREPLDIALEGRQPETADWVQSLLQQTAPASSGLTVRDVMLQHRKAKEIVWCDDDGSVKGVVLIDFLPFEQQWGVNAIAVDPSLPKDERRVIADAIYDELFRRDWMRATSATISPAAMKSRHRRFLQRLMLLPEVARQSLLNIASVNETERRHIERLLSPSTGSDRA